MSSPILSPLLRGPTRAATFYDRRQLLQGLGLGAAGLALGSCGPRPPTTLPAATYPPGFHFDPWSGDLPSPVERHQVTPQAVAGRHNNFYEFLPNGAGDVQPKTLRFAVAPWQLRVDGLCRHPTRFDLADLFALPHQERLYHFRCVERWAMNVPWLGIPLSQLLERVEPTDDARWVVFTSAADRRTMPGIDAASHYPWPYREALRLDEAMHPLAFLATGVYGAPLPKQHGAPIRLVVPWKYGYKSAKSLVSIELVAEPPSTFWSEAAPHEYGLLSNVNPNIPHPRWSQDVSLWLRDDPVWPTADDAFPTPLFNGYEEQVASLYPDEPRTPQAPLVTGQVAR